MVVLEVKRDFLATIFMLLTAATAPASTKQPRRTRGAELYA